MNARHLLTLSLLIFALLTPGCNALPATIDPIPAPVTPAPLTPDAPPAETFSLDPIDLRTGYGVENNWFGIYFSDPFSPVARAIEGGPDLLLEQAIDSARQSVDVAVYSFNLWSIRDALIRAQDRGVTVRVVMDIDNARDDVPLQLDEAGIDITTNPGSSLMHNKFVVIDRREVWTGSTNFTVSGVYYSNNNLVRIRSTELAEDYTTEFEEMFNDGFFGEDVLRNTPNPRLDVNGIPMEVYFAPDDQPADRIVELLNGAERSIYFMAFSFTSDEFAEAIIDRYNDGVEVRGVMEEEQVKSNTGTEYDNFRQLGIPVLLDGVDGDMHHKVFIIDEHIVITGSYNFSRSAEERNDENVLIIFSPEVAAHFMEEFGRVFSHTQP